jgi:hypothetical protein
LCNFRSGSSLCKNVGVNSWSARILWWLAAGFFDEAFYRGR